MPGCITTSSQVAICMGLAPQLSMSLILNPWVPSLGCEHDAGGPLSVALLAVAGGTYGVRTMWSLRLSRWWMSYPSPHRLRHPYLRIPHSSYHRHRQLAACSVHYRRRNHPDLCRPQCHLQPRAGSPTSVTTAALPLSLRLLRYYLLIPAPTPTTASPPPSLHLPSSPHRHLCHRLLRCYHPTPLLCITLLSPFLTAADSTTLSATQPSRSLPSRLSLLPPALPPSAPATIPTTKPCQIAI